MLLIDASIEEEDDEPFEISDYTNATPWEELTANIETILRNWSLFDCTVGPWNRRSIIKSGQLQARYFQFRITCMSWDGIQRREIKKLW